MTEKSKDVLLPAIVGGTIGAVFARSIEALTRPGGSPKFLAALVYGPLLEFGDLERPVAWAAGLNAVLFALVWRAGGDRRWLPLATVLTAGWLLGVTSGVGADLSWSSLGRLAAGQSMPHSDLRTFSHHSPEGFVFLSLGAAAWCSLVIGVLVRGWGRREFIPSGIEPSQAASGAARLVHRIVRTARDHSPPAVAGAILGYAVGVCVDDAEALVRSPWRRVFGGPMTLRLVAGGPAAFLSVGEPTPRFALAALFAFQSLLLWHACDGPRLRRLAAAWYVLSVAAQIATAAAVAATIGLDRLAALEGPGLRLVVTEMPGRLGFLALAVLGWHACAVWCLARYRPGRERPE
ncbi:MAG TPA: hypothetical protein VF170_00665 [Planctomycetaceae bacterium]